MKSRRNLSLALAVLVWANLPGCARRQAMYDQPKIKPFRESEFFADSRAMRLPPENTVARGESIGEDPVHTGTSNGSLVQEIPVVVDRAFLERGADRYKIFCTPCHSQIGDGLGMIVRRGMYPPPSFHIDRLRVAPAGHLYTVIGNGMGKMNGYAGQIPVMDRWAIVAYVRALQLSQNATMADVPSEARQKLESSR
jgi:hypothetical protein